MRGGRLPGRGVAPAFADAPRGATGIRFTDPPSLRDQVWRAPAGRRERHRQ
ncbi:hypothetical protein ACH4E7_35625 [Kitasatospora sp. NPDC018058]|uniref:hypothetical protein n=1 Tax=Kitasatospora sp. NPDC018058 TaxID=3364025 RepID=UPI0037C1189B